MKRFGFIRTVLLLLIFALATPALAGCEAGNGGNDFTESEKDQVEMSDEEKVQIFLSELAAMAESKDGSEAKELEAMLYYQNMAMSAEFSLEVVFENEDIYISGNLCTDVSYVESLEIAYDEKSVVYYASRFDSEMPETLEKINNNKGFCLLKTETEEYTHRYAVCCIDDIYYFLSFSEQGNLARIHYLPR